MAAFREEVSPYLRGGRFRVASRDGALRFYESDLQPGVVVVEGGAGRERAEEATNQVIKRYAPDFIVSAGFAGAVEPGLRPGDLFVCDRLMSIEGPAAVWRADSVMERSLANDSRYSLEAAEREGAEGYPRCGCLSVPEFVSGGDMKEWIGSTFPVSIVDMESYWVSEVADAHHVRHVVVRSVLDPADQTLPPFVGHTVRDETGGRWGRAAKYLASHPAEAPTMIRLAMQSRTAGASLARFLTGLQIADEPIVSRAV